MRRLRPGDRPRRQHRTLDIPDTHECPACCQSLVELAVGVSADGDGNARWLALASRCVGCGRVTGLTDAVLDGRPVEEVLASV